MLRDRRAGMREDARRLGSFINTMAGWPVPVGTDRTVATKTGKVDNGIYCSKDDMMKWVVEWWRLAERGHDRTT